MENQEIINLLLNNNCPFASTDDETIFYFEGHCVTYKINANKDSEGNWLVNSVEMTDN